MSTTLKSVRRELDSWRRQRTAKNAGIPAHLRHRIVRLLDDHKWDEIGKGLQISTSLVAKWRREQGWKSSRGRRQTRQGGCQALVTHRKQPTRAQKDDRAAKAAFIEVPTLSGFGGGEVVVEVNGASGATLRLRGVLDPASLQTLARAVVGGQQA